MQGHMFNNNNINNAHLKDTRTEYQRGEAGLHFWFMTSIWFKRSVGTLSTMLVYASFYTFAATVAKVAFVMEGGRSVTFSTASGDLALYL